MFIAEDPHSPDALWREGKLAFDFGSLWMKGKRIAAGQTNVKACNRKLRDLIVGRHARPSQIVSHELPPGCAPEGCQHSGVRDEGWAKVVLKAAARSATDA